MDGYGVRAFTCICPCTNVCTYPLWAEFLVSILNSGYNKCNLNTPCVLHVGVKCTLLGIATVNAYGLCAFTYICAPDAFPPPLWNQFLVSMLTLWSSEFVAVLQLPFPTMLQCVHDKSILNSGYNI